MPRLWGTVRRPRAEPHQPAPGEPTKGTRSSNGLPPRPKQEFSYVGCRNFPTSNVGKFRVQQFLLPTGTSRAAHGLGLRGTRVAGGIRPPGRPRDKNAASPFQRSRGLALGGDGCALSHRSSFRRPPGLGHIRIRLNTRAPRPLEGRRHSHPIPEHGKELKEMFSGLSRSMNNMDFGGMDQQVQMLSAMSRTMRPAASDLIGSPSRFIHRRSGRMLFPTCEDPSAIAPNRTPSRGSPTEAQQRADHRDKGFSTRKARAVLRRQPVRRSPQWQGVGMPSERTS